MKMKASLLTFLFLFIQTATAVADCTRAGLRAAAQEAIAQLASDQRAEVVKQLQYISNCAATMNSRNTSDAFKRAYVTSSHKMEGMLCANQGEFIGNGSLVEILDPKPVELLAKDYPGLMYVQARVISNTLQDGTGASDGCIGYIYPNKLAPAN